MITLALIPFLIAAATSPLVMQLLTKLKSRQTISAHIQEHAHKQGTPTMGGLMILIGGLSGCALNWSPELLGPVLLLVGFGLIGFVDDFVVPRLMEGKRGLGWKQKLVMEVLLCIGALYFSGFRDPMAMGVGSFVILFFSNAYNFSDGIDGLAGSLGVILFGGLLLMGGPVASSPMAPISVGLICGFLVFLYWNRYPAKVFMGDVGALPIGAVLGYLVFAKGSAQSTNSITLWAGLGILSLVMMAELIPVPLQIVSVKLTGKRMFLKTPIHHGFQVMGWKESKIVWLFAGVQAICAVVAVLLIGGGK
ncbi:MAG: hypothetical protein K8R88_11740 [Armatimonadetes bacterium]|nr:hypothetical protein [Armatimonadota bacterium]